MSILTLYDDGIHRNLLIEVGGRGGAVQTNQHLIVDGGSAMLLDPGGNLVYAGVRAAVDQALRGAELERIFLSHQDPDVVAAVSAWLMTTDAVAHIAAIWTRFVPHFGVDELMMRRVLPIADEGTVFELGGKRVIALPAHFLHSPGNFQLYDPVSRILYTGDLGASLATEQVEVQDFASHAVLLGGFHRRFMASRKVLQLWAQMVRTLDIEVIAPQHGALFRGKAMAAKFIEWCEAQECGVDLLEGWRVPTLE